MDARPPQFYNEQPQFYRKTELLKWRPLQHVAVAVQVVLLGVMSSIVGKQPKVLQLKRGAASAHFTSINRIIHA